MDFHLENQDKNLSSKLEKANGRIGKGRGHQSPSVWKGVASVIRMSGSGMEKCGQELIPCCHPRNVPVLGAWPSPGEQLDSSQVFSPLPLKQLLPLKLVSPEFSS